MGRRIAALASRQHGVVSVRQLRALGLDKAAVHRRVENGLLHPLHRGVYAVGRAGVSARGRYLAAVMACGPGAVLSHRSAADLWQLRPNATRLEVTIPRTRTGPAGIQVHRSRMLELDDFTRRDGIPVTTVARTLLDLSAVVPARDLARALDRAERLGLFDLRALERLLDRANGHRGITALRSEVNRWEPSHAKSELERRFKALVEASDLPSPLFNALVDGEQRTHEVDALWPERRLVVQLDGFEYHRTRRDRERDASSDADLELAGHRVMRLTWGDVTVHGERTLRRLAPYGGQVPAAAVTVTEPFPDAGVPSWESTLTVAL